MLPQVAAQDEAIASNLQETLQRLHETADNTPQCAHLRQCVLELVDDMVHNYLAAGTRFPLMLKKMVVGALRDDLQHSMCSLDNLPLQLRACVVRMVVTRCLTAHTLPRTALH